MKPWFGTSFPDPQKAEQAVTAITVRFREKSYIFGYVDFIPHKDDIEYFRCYSEIEMLRKFLDFWNEIAPDIITGWNINGFDIPYLYNRLSHVMGEDQAQRLSPWGVVRIREKHINGKLYYIYTILGISILDYIEIYKKFIPQVQESYALDYIAQQELGRKKLDYSEYGSLNQLYFNNPQKYFEYNEMDVLLVEDIDKKRQFINLVILMAYHAKINFDDALGSVKLWDCIIHSHLLQQNIVIPPKVESPEKRNLVGGFVKEPRLGMTEWAVSFDLTSLYPHLILWANLSPETFRGKLGETYTIEDIIAEKTRERLPFLKANNCALAGNLCLYTKEFQGFLPALMESMFNERQAFKNQMIAFEKKKELEHTEIYDNDIAKFKGYQEARKVSLNSRIWSHRERLFPLVFGGFG